MLTGRNSKWRPFTGPPSLRGNTRSEAMIRRPTVGPLCRNGGDAERALKPFNHSPLHVFKVAFDAATGGVAMPAAAEQLGHLRHVVCPLGSEAHPINAGRNLFEESDRFDFARRKRVVDYAIRVFF